VSHLHADVKSSVYFEQMKGEDKVISSTDFNAVTPDALNKTTYHCGCGGVCENDKTDSRPLEKKRSIPFDKLLSWLP